jgi:hypothetical protein
MGKILFIAALFFSTLVAGQSTKTQQPGKYEVKRMSFNSDLFNDISPVVVKDGIFFCSDRRFSLITDRTSFTGNRLYNFYLAAKRDTAEFRKPVVVETKRSYLFNNGPLCFSPDGRTIYFTSEIVTSNLTNSRGFKNHLGIFYAPYDGDKVGNISPFNFNNNGYNAGQPSVSSDGRFLFFASDMPGGFGGSDIYSSEFINGEWSDPVNLGPGVNSAATENYPYIHPSGKLFFASNRTGGYGKLDLYFTTLTEGVWQTPSLLPQDINSPYDDFALIAEDNLQKGYFASNRGSTDDIYEFTSSMKRMALCDTIRENSYCFRFTEENAAKSDSIPFRYVWNFGDGTKEYGIVVEHCYSGPGIYELQLDAENLETNEIIFNQKTEIVEVLDVEQPYISAPDTTIAGKPVRLNADKTNLPGWNIGHYYWNFGDETDLSGKDVEKIYRTPGVYNVQLIVYDSSEGSNGTREACVSKNIVVIPRR